MTSYLQSQSPQQGPLPSPIPKFLACFSPLEETKTPCFLRAQKIRERALKIEIFDREKKTYHLFQNPHPKWFGEYLLIWAPKLLWVKPRCHVPPNETQTKSKIWHWHVLCLPRRGYRLEQCARPPSPANIWGHRWEGSTSDYRSALTVVVRLLATTHSLPGPQAGKQSRPKLPLGEAVKNRRWDANMLSCLLHFT